MFAHHVAGGTALDLQQLRIAARGRRKQAFRPGTHLNHRVQIRTFIAFCKFYQLQDINPQPDTICVYIEFLARQFVSVKSIKNYLHGVAYLHKELGHPCPALGTFSVQIALRALSRSLPQVERQRSPITPEMLCMLCELARRQRSYTGAVITCAILLAFFGLLRCSSLAPPTAAAFNRRTCLCRGDVVFEEPGLRVFIRSSKTRVDPSHFHILPIAGLGSHQLCPRSATAAMVQAKPAGQNTPLLQAKDGSPITAGWLRAQLRELLQQAGYSAERFTFHSLRRGGATFAHRLGLGLQAIKQQGDWRSDAVKRYVDAHFRDTELTKEMAQAIVQGLP